MPSRRAGGTGLVLAVLIMAACGADVEQPDGGQAIEEEGTDIAAAAQRFHPEVFDTMTWDSPEAAVVRGREVWSIACAQCHGEEARGDTGYVTEDGDTLHPPSFQVADWRFAEDPAGLRQQIFLGSEADMPHWGLRRMDPRDIDAVARYIQEELVTGA